MKKTNILLVMADDMGFSDIGCYGSEIETKNLDKLAKNGIKYSQMYNCARCCPTRASLLTGLSPHKAGLGLMTGNLGTKAYQGYLRDDCVTIAEVLKTAGYNTGMSGKWHVGGKYDSGEGETGDKTHPTPLQRGFDRYYGILEGATNYFGPHTLMDQNEMISIAPDEDYYFTDAISENASKMINEFSHDDNPFFMYVAYTAPHWPLHARKEDIEKYKGKYAIGWDKVRENRYKRLIELDLIDENWDLSPRDVGSYPWEETEHKEWEDMRMAVYAAQIDSMDRGIGNIIQTLKDNNQLDNTLFMFLSDNGGCAEYLHEDGWVRDIVYPIRDGSEVIPGNDPNRMPGGEDTYMSYDLPWSNASNTPFRYFKHWTHEGGISTPFIVHWPDYIKNNNSINNQPFHVSDLMSTCIDVANAKYPQKYKGVEITPIDSVSLVKSFNDKNYIRKDPIFWEHEGNCAVRLGKYKLVKEYPKSWELYDIEKDRTELNDIVADNKHIANELIEMYKKWAEENEVVDWERISGKKK